MERELFEGAYRKYWDRIECWPNPVQLHSYEICDAIGNVVWHVPFIDQLIDGELRESINLLNEWGISLVDLEIWSEILCDYNEDDAWSLRLHFVEPLVHRCMLQPSSTRDRLGLVATNSIHQANLCTVTGYKDVLDQDKPKRRKFMRRTEVEIQLERLVKHWSSGDRLLAALQSLDSPSHRQQTYDYRNRASHFIAPRLELGAVYFVSRKVAPWTKLVLQKDGTYIEEEVPEKTGVEYGFSFLQPVSLKEIIEINLSEYRFAFAAMQAYSELLREAMAQMTERQKVRET